MMIKNVLSGALCLIAFSGTFAQSGFVKPQFKKIKLAMSNAAVKPHPSENLQSGNKTTALFETDTLWYFRNKQQYKDPLGDQGYYGVYLSTGTSTNGDFVEYGSSFLNTSTGSPITIEGARILVSRHPDSQNASIPVKVYVYNATATGVPTTKVDSVMITVSTSGQFVDAVFASPKTVTGSFFISYKTMATSPLDTLVAFATSGAKPSNTSVPPNERFGDGLSYIRGFVVNPPFNQMYLTQDYLFGTGYDPEAVVVPVVSYSINPNFKAPLGNAANNPNAYCNNKAITFTNTTNPASVVYNRQFNFNRFITYWAPTTFSGSTLPDPADPIDNWSFSTGTSYTTTNASVTAATPLTLVTTLEIKYRHSPEQPDLQLPSVSDSKTATYSIVDCTDTGFGDLSAFAGLSVYPNPMINGKTTISGLSGNNVITVYDLLGQLVSVQSSDKQNLSIDLLNQPAGTYVVKIENAFHNTKVLKIINQN